MALQYLHRWTQHGKLIIYEIIFKFVYMRIGHHQFKEISLCERKIGR